MERNRVVASARLATDKSRRKLRLLPFVVVCMGICYCIHNHERRHFVACRSIPFDTINTRFTMKKVKLGLTTTLEIYDSIDELPMARFHRYNKMMLIDANIGSDLAAIDKHIERVKAFITARKNESAITELDNLRQSVFFAQNNVTPRSMAFAALVKSINGRPCDDLTDEGLQKVVDKIADLPMMQIATLLEAAKKKIDDELTAYFPNLFDDADSKEYHDLLRKRTLALLKSIIEGATESTEVEELTTELLAYVKPQTFNGAKNFEVEYDKQFERLCFQIRQELGGVDPKLYTVMEYYNAFECLKEQQKAKQREIARLKARGAR